MKRLKAAALAAIILYVLGGASWATWKYFDQQGTFILLKAVEIRGNVRCTKS